MTTAFYMFILFLAKVLDNTLNDITGDVTEKYQVKPWDALDDELLKKRIVRDCILF